eukprot:gene22482-23661_t
MVAIGAPSQRHLRKIFTIAAVIAGIAGGLLTQTTETVSLETLSFTRSADLLVILILGGIGRLYGGILGAIIYLVARDQFSDINPQYWYFWIGLLLIAVVTFLPNGLLGGLAQLFALRRKGARVRQGLVRTFQINTLYPQLTPLEAVTLAVCERRGESATWWRPLSRYAEAISEAHDILVSLRLAHVETRTTRELDESADLFDVIANLSRDLSVLFIEHDMNLVFRFASRIIVMVGGKVLLSGTPAEIAHDPRVREVYLGRKHHA